MVVESFRKKNKDQVQTPMISKRPFYVKTKKYKSSKDYFVL